MSPEPSPTKLVAVMTPALPNFILLPTSKKSSTSSAGAVIIPTESIFVTSSYVYVPAIETLPEKVPSTAVTFPEKDPPVAVIIPVDLILCTSASVE